MNDKLFLNKMEIDKLDIEVNKYKSILNEALYDQYKRAYEIANSSSYSGVFADRYKSYMKTGVINVINGCLNMTEKLSEVSDKLEKMFSVYERDEKGKIENETLGWLLEELQMSEREYDDYKQVLSSTMSSLTTEIDYKEIHLNAVNIAYGETKNQISKISSELLETDIRVLSVVNNLYSDIVELKNQVIALKEFIYNPVGDFLDDRSVVLNQQTWYKKNDEKVLNEILEEEPYYYVDQRSDLYNVQWRGGLTSDIYTYTEHSKGGVRYETKLEDGKNSNTQNLHVQSVYKYSQFTDFYKEESNISWGYLDYEAKGILNKDKGNIELNAENKLEVGFTEYESSRYMGIDLINYKEETKVTLFSESAGVKGKIDLHEKNGVYTMDSVGAELEGEASVAKAETTRKLGNDYSFFYVKEKGDVLSGEIKAGETLDIDSANRDGKLGVGASGYGIGGTYGVNWLSYKDSWKNFTDDKNEKFKPLLAAEVTLSHSAGYSFFGEVKSDEVFSAGPIELNAKTYAVDLEALGGISVAFTNPAIEISEEAMFGLLFVTEWRHG